MSVVNEAYYVYMWKLLVHSGDGVWGYNNIVLRLVHNMRRRCDVS